MEDNYLCRDEEDLMEYQLMEEADIPHYDEDFTIRVRYGDHLIGRDFWLKAGDYQIDANMCAFSMTRIDLEDFDGMYNKTPVERVDNIEGHVLVIQDDEIIFEIEARKGMSLCVDCNDHGFQVMFEATNSKKAQSYTKVIDVTEKLYQR